MNICELYYNFNILLLLLLFTLVEGKNIWKRSTMETQIQVAQTSLRERITMDKTPNKIVVDCIQEKAKNDSSPVYISTKSGADQKRIIIKCISCDEDNKYGKDIQGKNRKDTL